MILIKHNLFRLALSISLFVVVNFFLFGVQTAEAVSPSVVVKDPLGFSAKFVSQSDNDPIEIEAGETKNITVTFKNTGSKTWDNFGKNYISAYTMEPRDRVSAFSNSKWISSKQTTKMSGVIKPGQQGSMIIPITAPSKVGRYVEKFYLASENTSWINNGYFYFIINVVKKKQELPQEITPQKTPDVIADIIPVVSQVKEASVKKLSQNIKSVQAVGGDKIKIIAIFQNTGEILWKDYSLVTSRPVSVASTNNNQTFADEDWVSHTEILQKIETVHASGVIREEFYMRAPKEVGNYQLGIAVKTGQQVLQDDSVIIDVHVTQNAPLNYKEVIFNSDQQQSDSINTDIAPSSLWLSSEPRIRVGMELPMDYVQFKSLDFDYRLVADGRIIADVPAGRLVVLSFDGIYYTVKANDIEYIDIYPPRLEPTNDEHAIFELINFDRYVKWKGPDNFNKYRGAFEYRQGIVDKKMYAVNDLLLEDYVAGIGETSNLAPKEYIRALLTAARTYAYKSLGKYPFFDVLGNTYDQLYLGYVSEVLMPQVAQSARDTRGYLVTYDNQIVITPYFANSAGNTKTWKSVWGGSDKPWLQPVVANYDVGQPMRGHGVGISARDAAQRADKEGVDWKYLLKYYYTGVDILRIFQ